MPLGEGPFTPDDFAEVSELAIAAWTAGLDRDWSVTAGTLEWSCFTTADHTVDGVFSYARAVLFGRAQFGLGDPQDFAARGALELILHTHDVCAGLGVPFDPPRELCARVRDHTRDWPGVRDIHATDDPWSDVLARSGRPRVA